jgi:predicted ATPase/class 3 adenylate cyclase/DNA-binding CsgD family transcriptional regulator
MREALPAGTVTFLVIDIEGSTRLLHALGDAYGPTLEEYRRLVRSTTETWHGHELSAEGDGFFLVFGRAPDAVQAAVAIQRQLAQMTPTRGGPVRARMGIHTGQPELKDNNYLGIDVHRAARIGHAGHGGQILLSPATRDLVEAELADDLVLRSLGEHWLKDISRPEHLWQLTIRGLAETFPSLRTVGRRISTVPGTLTTFIGREEIIAEASALMSRTRLLTLTGPGGTGKTRLAIQLAEMLRDQFHDGVWFVALAPTMDPDLVIPTVLQALGIPVTQGRLPDEVLCDALREKNLLLVLDNFEQVVHAGPRIAAVLAACPQMRLLVTSRVSLHVVGEQELEVPPLALPPREERISPSLLQNEAVRLFVERARAVKPEFQFTDENASAVVGICGRLDGLPLAIELAAARIRLLPPATMLARLGHQPDTRRRAGGSSLRLLGGGARDQADRQRTLRSTIGWSYDLLDPDERALFRRLSVFVGGFTLESAEAAAAAQAGDSRSAFTAEDTLELLESLLSKHLIRQYEYADSEPRFTMLETIREYGLEQLEASGELYSIRLWHAEHLLALAERAEQMLRGRDQAEWITRLETEHENLRTALEWCLSEQRTGDLGLRLAASLSWFWQMQAYIGQGRGWFQRILDHPWPDTLAKAKTLVGQAWLAHIQREPDRARAALAEALVICREQGDRWLEGWALHLLGRIAYFEGDSASAHDLGQQSLQAARETSSPWLEGWAIHLLGLAAHIDGDYPTAIAHYEESVAIRQQLGYMEGVATCRILMAIIAYRERRLEDAAALMQQGLQELPRMAGMAALSGLGVAVGVAADSGQTDIAARLLGATRALSRMTGSAPIPLAEAIIREVEGRIEANLGPEEYQRAWSEGQAMTLSDTIAQTLLVRPAAERFDAEAVTGPGRSILTEREETVLRLLVLGQSNREIADALVVSLATVERHLTHIYTKLGVRGRPEAIAWALRGGIVD